MKTQLTVTQKAFGFENLAKRAFTFFGIVMMTLLVSNTAYAQTDKATASDQITVKGLVSDEEGPLPGVNITLKNANVGTSTDKDGMFTFPKALSVGDVLVFTYLGYETQEIRIRKNTSFIKLLLSTDLVEILGAVNEDKPYKSKRSN